MTPTLAFFGGMFFGIAMCAIGLATLVWHVERTHMKPYLKRGGR